MRVGRDFEMNATWLRKTCTPCKGDTPSLSKEQALQYLGDIPAWQLSTDTHSIRRDYRMKDFMAAIDFIHEIAKLAESEGHHPDIHLTGYRNLAVELSTHSIGGLSENDFILAAKIDALPKELKTDK